jgi:predicted Zn-dependent protease
MIRILYLAVFAVLIPGCLAATSPVPSSRRAPQPASLSQSTRTGTNSSATARLSRVIFPLVQVMDRPCRPEEVRIGLINEADINAANAGNCEFYVTTGLLRRAGDEQLLGVMAHEIAHQDLGHAAKAQVLGTGLNLGAAVLQQIFPGAGALAPLAGTLIARGYSRTEEYAADRHGIDLLRRAGYSKDVMVNTLSWIRRASGGESGGGFLSTHPALDDRIAALQKLR